MPVAIYLLAKTSGQQQLWSNSAKHNCTILNTHHRLEYKQYFFFTLFLSSYYEGVVPIHTPSPQNMYMKCVKKSNKENKKNMLSTPFDVHFFLNYFTHLLSCQ